MKKLYLYAVVWQGLTAKLIMSDGSVETIVHSTEQDKKDSQDWLEVVMCFQKTISEPETWTPNKNQVRRLYADA